MVAEHILSLFASSLWLILPAYFANSSPVYFTSKLKKLHPVDFNRKFIDGRPILGPGKTFEGAFFGIITGTIVGTIQTLLQERFASIAALLYPMSVKLGFILSLSAILGDMVGSFIKRRVGMKRGAKTPLLDSMDFLIPSLIIARVFVGVGFEACIFLLVVTPVIHRAMNVLAYRLGMKDVPW